MFLFSYNIDEIHQVVAYTMTIYNIYDRIKLEYLSLWWIYNKYLRKGNG